MKKRSLIPILLFLWFFSFTVGNVLAQDAVYLEDFKIKTISKTTELSTLLGLTSTIKIPIKGENISLTLILHIYRTEESLLGVSHQPVEPVEKRPIGTMYLSSRGEPHILLVIQELLLHGEREMILHWGLGEEEEGSHKLSHSRILLDVEELKDPSYRWNHGLFSPETPMWDTPFPIYVFRGMKTGDRPMLFRSSDSIHRQAQLHHMLLVVYGQLSQRR